MLKAITNTAAYLVQKGIIHPPQVGVVLGTGLGTLVEKMQVQLTIPYEIIPGFPLSTVEFHKGQLVYGTIDDITVVALQGRFHYYEGYSMQEITFPIRVLKSLGVQQLLLSNAAGGLNPLYKKGDLVLIDDHINLLPENPLRGLNDPAYGNRFVDMSSPYSKSLNKKIKSLANKSAINLHEGIYVAVMGPNLETRAEYRWLRSTGADIVGMSTIPEVIVANHIGLPCAAISVITDECDPDDLKPVDISEIIAVANEADIKLSKLMELVISDINQE